MTTVRLEGDMTIGEAAVQQARVLEAAPEGAGALVLDLSGIEACDSAGVQLLVATYRMAEARGFALTLSQVPECVDDALAVYDLRSDALAEVEA